MATATPVLRSLRSTAAQERTRLGWRDSFITILLGLWLMIGLFVDGWAHNNLSQLETFFTPWHALFYTGFMANAAWLAWLVYREWRAGRIGIAAIPRGYHLGLLGVFIFGVGGVGDMLWHIIFGIEKNISALLSPTHLLLFLGGSLILSSPFAAAWGAADPAEDAPSFKAFLPALGSLTLMMCFASFMNMYLWAFIRNMHTAAFEDRYMTRFPDAIEPIMAFSQSAGLEGILITNVILLAPVLLMLRRWHPPFGSVTFMFTLNAILMCALTAFRFTTPIAIALGVGLATDALIRTLKPWRSGAAYRAVATGVPLLLWSLYFIQGLLDGGLAWPLELTAGITVMAALSGLALSLLMAPPALPAHLDSR